MSRGPGILVTVFKAIGDVLLTTPLVRALKKNVPGSRVYFLTRRPSLQILEHNPYLDGVFCREDSPALAIRRAGIDLAFDYMCSTSSAFYTLFSGASRRAAFDFRGAWAVYNRRTPRRSVGYVVEDRLLLLGAVGIKDDGVQTDFLFPQASAARADRFLADNAVAPGELAVTLDVTSKREQRRWSPENFARLADALKNEHGARVIFLSGPGEADYVGASLAAAREKHLYCPDFSLQDLAALQRRIGLHVGTSSAPMHIAVSQGLPTFTIYAQQTSPVSWTPPQPEHGYVQAPGPDLSALPFEAVREALNSHIASLKAGRAA